MKNNIQNTKQNTLLTVSLCIALTASVANAQQQQGNENNQPNENIQPAESLPSAPTPTPTPVQEQCVPLCRSGYSCKAGDCVSICNPSCAENEKCTAQGECVADLAPTPEQIVEPEKPEAEQKYFMDSLFSARLELLFGVPFGDIMSQEGKVDIQEIYENGESKSVDLTHMSIQGGLSVELAPLRMAGFKFAIRAGYLFSDIEQSGKVGGGNYERKSWTETLLTQHTALFGPVVYIGNRWYGSFHVLVGPSFGTLSPAPVGQKAVDVRIPDESFSGWMLRLGPGFGYSFKRIIVGGNLVYSLTGLTLKEKVYTDLGKDNTVHAILFNAYIGAYL